MTKRFYNSVRNAVSASVLVTLVVIAVSTDASPPPPVEYPPGLFDNAPEVIASQAARRLADDYAHLGADTDAAPIAQVDVLLADLEALARVERALPSAASSTVRARALQLRAIAW